MSGCISMGVRLRAYVRSHVRFYVCGCSWTGRLLGYPCRFSVGVNSFIFAPFLYDQILFLAHC